MSTSTPTRSPPRLADPPFRRRLLGNVASNYAGKIVAMAAWLLLTPLMLETLGPVQYGLWVVIASVTAYGWMLDVFGGAVAKYVSEHVARGEHRQAEAVVSTALWIYLGAAVGLVVLSLVAAPLVPRVFGIAPEDHALASGLVVVMGLTIALGVAFLPIDELMQGLHRYDLHNLVNGGGSVLYALSAGGVLLAGGGLLEMAIVNLPVTVAIRAVALALLRRAAPEVRISWSAADRATARRLVSFGSGSFALLLTDQLDMRSDEIIIACFLPVAAVTPYSLARRLSSISNTIAMQFQKVVMPIASGLDARGRRDAVRQTFLVSSRVTMALLVPSALVIGVLASQLLTLWVGPEYADAAPIVVILALALVLRGATMPARSVLQGMARQRFIAAGSLGAGVLNVVGSVILIRSHGLVGVAAASALSALALQLVVVRHALRVLEIPAGELAREVWVPTLTPALPAAAVALLFAQPGSPGSIPPALLGALAVYGAGYLLGRAAGPERAALAELASRAIPAR